MVCAHSGQSINYNVSEILNEIQKVIQLNAFETAVCIMANICLNLNVLSL